MASRTYDLSHVAFLAYDPNGYARRLTMNVLRAFRVGANREAPSLDAAWNAIEAKTPDIFLMDWGFDHEGEAELIGKIRGSQEEKIRFLPVIAVSTYADPDRVFGARDIGINEYLLKPFSPKSLYLRIAAVIGRPRRFVKVGEYFGPDRRRMGKEVDPEEERRKGDSTEAVVRAARKPGADAILSQREVNTMINPQARPDDDDKEEARHEVGDK